MDSPRIASSATPHAAHAARQKTGAGALQAPGGFSALLSSLDDSAQGSVEALGPAGISTNTSASSSLLDRPAAEGPALARPEDLNPGALPWGWPLADPAAVVHSADLGDAVENPSVQGGPVAVRGGSGQALAAAAVVPKQDAPLAPGLLGKAPAPRAELPQPPELAAPSSAAVVDGPVHLGTSTGISPAASGVPGTPANPGTQGATAPGDKSGFLPNPGLAEVAAPRLPGAVPEGALGHPAAALQSPVAGRGAVLQRVVAAPSADAVPTAPATLNVPVGAGPGAGLVAQTARMDAGVAATGHAAEGPPVPSAAGTRQIAATGPDKAYAPAQAAGWGLGRPAWAAPVGKPAPGKEAPVLPGATVLQQVASKGEPARTGLHDPVVATGLSVPPLAVAALAAEPRRGEPEARPGERHHGGGFAPGLAGLGDSGAPHPLESGSASASAVPGSPEEAVTEQVTYWLGENLKNAELTVDHAGQPVEVRVALNGNEAHVTFRTDQAHTRELLDASMDQLRDLLQREGLVLSGVSVDAQGAQQQRDSGGEHPPGEAQTAEAAVTTEPGMAGARRILTEHSVDLFV